MENGGVLDPSARGHKRSRCLAGRFGDQAGKLVADEQRFWKPLVGHFVARSRGAKFHKP